MDVPAFHEGFADLVALFLHFTYADIVEQAIRESRGGAHAGSLLTDIAREFGYARTKEGRGHALRSGVDVEGIAAFDSDVMPRKARGRRPTTTRSSSPRTRLGAGLGSLRGIHDVVKRKSDRLFRIAGLDPQM